jgi:hypothetical protein
MRILSLAVATMLLVAAPALAARTTVDFTSADQVLRWINSYRAKPDPANVPAAIRALSGFTAFKDTENAGVYVGFLAGVLSANADRAEEIIDKLRPISQEDQWAVIRSIAYSGLPNWKDILERQIEYMPMRRVLIDKYLNASLPTLKDAKIEKNKEKTWIEEYKEKIPFLDKPKKNKDVRLDPSPDLLDTYWGFYFATGELMPVKRLVEMLPLSKERDNVDKLTVGSMAKYTLASNAARDPSLLATLKRTSLKQPKETLLILNEVIDAAESVELAAIRREAMDAINELKAKGPGSKREVAWWGQAAEGAIGLGCVAAAATGQVALGLPCVIGGATSSAAARYLATP